MSIQKFEETGRGRGRRSTGPRIPLRKSGSISINRLAMEVENVMRRTRSKTELSKEKSTEQATLTEVEG